jgi:hypothetical protein
MCGIRSGDKLSPVWGFLWGFGDRFGRIGDMDEEKIIEARGTWQI